MWKNKKQKADEAEADEPDIAEEADRKSIEAIMEEIDSWQQTQQ